MTWPWTEKFLENERGTVRKSGYPYRSMLDGLIFFFFLVLAWSLIAPIIAIVHAARTRRELEALKRQVMRLQGRLHVPTTGEAPKPSPMATAPVAHDVPEVPTEPALEAPPLPVSRIGAPAPVVGPAVPPLWVKPVPQSKSGKDSELEQFLGGKVAAWLGGLALFLGVVLFVKYAFDRNLVSPALRVAGGFATGLGLVVTGVLMRHRKRYLTLTQTLIATGILISYGSAYAAHVLYQLPGFSQAGTLFCMGGITAAAFVVAVRLQAPVVAVLGMVGGFLTPWLVHTEEDQALALFSYVMILNLGLIAVASTRRWVYLPACAALGTTVTMFAWYSIHFHSGGYADGRNIEILAGVFLLFPCLFTAASYCYCRRDPDEHWTELLLAGPLLLIVVGGILCHILVSLPALREPPHLVMGTGATLALLLLILHDAHRFPAASLCATVGLAWLAFLGFVAPNRSEYPEEMLAWCIGLILLLGAYPFMRRSTWQPTTAWASSALAYLLFFPTVYCLVGREWANEMMGLVPAAFSLPVLVSLVAASARNREHPDLLKSNRVWYGGVAVFLLAAIVPAQLSDQWISIGWAVQGAALCWFSTRAQGHSGVRLSGVVLLTAAFATLALHRVVLDTYVRTGPAMWNWMTYTFGITAVCLAAGARWLAPPRDRFADVNVRAFLQALCGILLFLLLQIQIANAFTEPGEQFRALKPVGNFAYSMTCSIAWALYALVLVLSGFVWRIPGARYAGLGLLGITLLKLFLHDFANIESLYRIAAFVVVAILALGAAFLYQRFAVGGDRDTSTTPPKG